MFKQLPLIWGPSPGPRIATLLVRPQGAMCRNNVFTNEGVSYEVMYSWHTACPWRRARLQHHLIAGPDAPLLPIELHAAHELNTDAL